jgi:hypothetical protein
MALRQVQRLLATQRHRCGRICVCFRGKGCLPPSEKAQYDKRVDVMFQPKAWFDRETCVEHAKRFIAPQISKTAESVLFLDNLNGHTTTEYGRTLKKMKMKRHLLPTETSDVIQVADAGVGQMVKHKKGELFERWLDESDNLERWCDGKITAAEKRILTTHLLAEAWEHVCETFDFEKKAKQLGAGLAADGSRDGMIQLQGLYHRISHTRSMRSTQEMCRRRAKRS